MKVLITTIPFGEKDKTPLELLAENGLEYTINPLGRKLAEEDLLEMLPGYDILIAGTEPITSRVLSACPDLKLISRVGIGLDSVDLGYVRNNRIEISYTPDAPAPAVAELTVGLVISLLRSVHLSNIRMHKGAWYRYTGKRISECTIGLIGAGRIGSRVAGFLHSLGCRKLLINDLVMTNEVFMPESVEWVDKDKIYSESDLISVHVPLTSDTHNMIALPELKKMKTDACLINTARGGIINESDLFEVMQSSHLSAAAIDVFDREPYTGNLADLDNCLLTAHMGSMSADCRARMEIEATEEAVRFYRGEPLQNPVPNEEFEIHMKEMNRSM
jgi:D-3-phosphoglycerate dehydrogenase